MIVLSFQTGTLATHTFIIKLIITPHPSMSLLRKAFEIHSRPKNIHFLNKHSLEKMNV
jgi:hypothetical protein